MTESSFSVSELNEYVRGKLQIDPLLKFVSVRGEISDYKQQAGSGHAYFTLKDEKAMIPCTMWRSNVSLLRFVPKPGEKVLVRGQVTLYVAGGKYQLIADSMRQEGSGDLFAQFEALKNRLMLEGLFDPAVKKPLPLLVKTIGVATSLNGAAIRDIIKVARARNPRIDIILAPCAVQGKGAEYEIAEAIDLLDRDGRADVILVGRGGGSMEDLWAFNEELVARAIYRCSKPVISCVGHETDFSIADFAADIRASTPSNAAELAVADVEELHGKLQSLRKRLNTSMLNTHKQRAQRLESIAKSHVFLDPKAALIGDRFRIAEEYYRRTEKALRYRTQKAGAQCDALWRTLNSLNPNNIKRRGYAVVRMNGAVISSIDSLNEKTLVTVEMQNGSFDASVIKLWRTDDDRKDQL